ncbi:MAG: LirA/MavJ family T4SS effector, partial [Cystobacter sp.]
MGHFDKKYEVDIKKSFPKFPYPKSFQRIQEVLDDQALVDHYLLQLDHQIAESVQRNRVEGYSVAQALNDNLRETEDREGFNKNEVKYVLGVLSTEEFYGMMEGPYAFLDPFVTPRHGAETHRIQWWIISQDLHAQPARYEAGVNAGKLFSST